MAVLLLIAGLAGVAVAGLLARRDPDPRIVVATLAGAAGGFGAAMLLALLLGRGVLPSLAIGAVSAAALALVLYSQWRLFNRVLRAGQK